MPEESVNTAPVTEELIELRARVRALECRHAEDALIRQATEQSVHGIAIADLNGIITFANSAFAVMHGYTISEVLGHHFRVFHAGEQFQPTGRVFEEQLNEASVHTGEVWHARKDGSAFPAWMSVTQLTDENRQPTGRVAIIRDITQQKRAETVLRESEAKFRAQFASLPVPAYIWQDTGGDFRLTDYNDAAMAMTQGKIVDFVGQSLTHMYGDCPEIMEDMRRCLTEKSSITREMPYRFKTTGEDKFLNVKYAYVPPDLVLVHTEDITARRQTEAALRESEQLLLEAQRLALTGSWQIDLVTEELHYSPTMRDIHGLDRSTISLREAFELVYPDDRAKVDAAYEQAVSSGPGSLVYRIVRPNGEVRTLFSPGARLIRDERGVPLRIVGVTQDITEQKRTEEALRESGERFRQLAENINDVFWLLDWTEQKIIYASKAYETVWGRSLSQLYEDPLDWLDAIHPDDRDRAEEAYFPAAVTSYNEVYRIIRPDGSLRWIHHRGFPIEDETGRVYRMAGIAEDITEHKLADEALRKSEERFRILYDNNPSMYFTVDADGIVTAVNQFGAEQLGYTVAELVGRPVLDIFHEDDRNEVKGQLVSCLQTPGRIAHWEYRKVCKDGRVVFVEEAARAVQDVAGRREVLVVCEDITDRKRVEEALLDSERRFRTLTSLAPVGIFQTDAQGDHLFVNQKWCEFAGVTAEEATGTGWPPALHPDDQERVYAEWRDAIDAGREFASEFRFSTDRGDLTWLFAVALALHDEKGKITGYLGTITDITKLKQAEKALRESEERFRLLYEDNPSMYFTLELDGTVLSVNKFGAEQLGYTVEELVGASVFDVFHPEDRASVRDQLEACGRQPGPIARWEYRKIRKDGRIIWVQEAARAVRWRDGRTVVLIVCEDITERRARP